MLLQWFDVLPVCTSCVIFSIRLLKWKGLNPNVKFGPCPENQCRIKMNRKAFCMSSSLSTESECHRTCLLAKVDMYILHGLTGPTVVFPSWLLSMTPWYPICRTNKGSYLSDGQVTSCPALSSELSRSGSPHRQQGLYTRKQSTLPLLTLSSTEVMNEGSSTRIPFTAVERSEGLIDPVTLSLRAKVTDRSNEADGQSFSRHLTQGCDFSSQSATSQTDDPDHTMVTVICVESSSEDGQ